jgi:hypothetical protein
MTFSLCFAFAWLEKKFQINLAKVTHISLAKTQRYFDLKVGQFIIKCN